jgi:ABC-type phosphate transport system substrate-binding protein
MTANKFLHFKLILAIFCVFNSTTGHSDIVVVVNSNNPIDTLQENDVKRIFLGLVGSFPKTGGPISVIDQSNKSDANRKFYVEINGFKTNKLKRYRAAYP